MDSLLSNFWFYIIIIILLVIIRDIFFQKTHTITHNFPLIGHFRYWIEQIGPEIRQYLIANNREELPFNRGERSWIYASSKSENNLTGFGSDLDFNTPGHLFLKNAINQFRPSPDHFTIKHPGNIPCSKVMGLSHQRKKPYRPNSIVNISGMSYGSLSAKAVESLNKGAYLAGCFHNTGEGSITPYHTFGADIVMNIGTSYFGVRDENGNFSMEKLLEKVEKYPQLRAIEIKLSQGAKPGKGGMLPASKINKEIAEIRGIPMGKDCYSPAYHTAFSNLPEMIDFIEEIAEQSGLPVGIKAAIGKLSEWEELAILMKKSKKGPDFITIDGGEGGTGAAPHSFTDHVSLPLQVGFPEVYKIFQKHQLSEDIFFIASGKLGFPEKTILAMAMGADAINIAREAMLSIGCIQAQKCHTNACPAGIATNSKWLQAGINIPLKSERFYRYHYVLLKEINEITQAMGYEHPSLIKMEDIDISVGINNKTESLNSVYGYEKTSIPFKGYEYIKKCSYRGANADRIDF